MAGTTGMTTEAPVAVDSPRNAKLADGSAAGPTKKIPIAKT